MRVLARVPLYPPASRVGSWLSTHECLLHLARRGHHVEVVRTMAGPKPDYDIDGITVHSGPGWRDLDHDLLVTHCGDVHNKGAVRMAHGDVTDLDVDGASLVVWNSQASAAAGTWDGPSVIVRPPVHADRYRTDPGDMVTLVNLSEAKGVRTFWRCAERLRDLSFLGVRGGYGTQVIPRARNIETVAHVDDMRQVYRRTRILLMPSAKETWGRVGVEAMASGIPVIAHPTAGLLESLSDAGIFVDRADHRAWVEEIQRLQDPDEWERASLKAKARSAELDPTPDLERFADAVEAVPA